jgi:hypothetical protein
VQTIWGGLHEGASTGGIMGDEGTWGLFLIHPASYPGIRTNLSG